MDVCKWTSEYFPVLERVYALSCCDEVTCREGETVCYKCGKPIEYIEEEL